MSLSLAKSQVITWRTFFRLNFSNLKKILQEARMLKIHKVLKTYDFFEIVTGANYNTLFMVVFYPFQVLLSIW